MVQIELLLHKYDTHNLFVKRGQICLNVHDKSFIVF